MLAVAMGSLALLSTADADVAAEPRAKQETAGVHGFDFLVGEWQVHHRLKRPTGEWWEFDGICVNRGLMGGAANVEEHTFNKPTGVGYGVALRAYDSAKDQWSIWWLDSRYPGGPVDPPNHGRFENGVGKFYFDYEDKGKPMQNRLTWSEITATSARWEQATSADGGKTWDTNWIMTFQRRQ
jgi:hypothetical protein